jgi:hypothetical protein
MVIFHLCTKSPFLEISFYSKIKRVILFGTPGCALFVLAPPLENIYKKYGNITKNQEVQRQQASSWDSNWMFHKCENMCNLMSLDCKE